VPGPTAEQLRGLWWLVVQRGVESMAAQGFCVVEQGRGLWIRVAGSAGERRWRRRGV